MKKILIALLVLTSSTQAVEVLLTIITDPQGMTEYVFDNDADGVSNCNGACAKVWPPVKPLVPEDKIAAPYSAITRKDGSKQLAYKNRPLYYYEKDLRPGDTKGDGLGGVWHVVHP